MKTDLTKLHLSFLATDPFIVDNVVKPTETTRRNGLTLWGSENAYPQYLESLYLNVPTLHTIVDGLVDYVCGDAIHYEDSHIIDNVVNRKGHLIEDIVRWLSKDLILYGGFAINVLRNKLGDIVSYHYVDFKNLRTNKEKTTFYYSEDWSKRTILEYPNFLLDEEAASSILYYSNSNTTTYPIPTWGSAVIPCEIEKLILNYNINLLNNGLSSNYIISLNNGVPNDEQKFEIERNFYEKFCGAENVGRPMIVYNDDKEHDVTIQAVPNENFAEKYDKLRETSSQSIFTAFRVTPKLFGITQENIGFSQQEYSEAYKLVDKTVVRPLQKTIQRFFKLLDAELTIEPFNIQWEDKNIEAEQ